MNVKLFDYIFRELKIAQKGQPIELFTIEGRTVEGRYSNSYNNSDNDHPLTEIIKLDIDGLGTDIFTYGEILKIKVTFVDEFIDGTCTYSLACMFDYFEPRLKVEVLLHSKVLIIGYLTMYPDDFNLYDNDISLISTDGVHYTLAFSQIIKVSITIEQQAYFNSFISNSN